MKNYLVIFLLLVLMLGLAGCDFGESVYTLPEETTPGLIIDVVGKGHYISRWRDDYVTLTAIPADGWIFSQWSGDVANTNKTMRLNKSTIEEEEEINIILIFLPK